MERVYQAEKLSMGWCLDCHRDPSRTSAPAGHITDMTWVPKEDPAGAGGPLDEGKRHPSLDGLLDMSSLETTTEPGLPDCGKSTHVPGTLLDLAAMRTVDYRDFLEAEFPAADDPQGISRRRWLQLMGASLALAGVAGCRWEKREIRPFAKRPADRVPGEFQRFATTMDMAGERLGLLVTCVDGRPIKVEGNPKHPSSLGATNAFAQAAILELYDPDRSKEIIHRIDGREEVRSWAEFAAFAREHFDELRKDGGAGLRDPFRGQ